MISGQKKPYYQGWRSKKYREIEKTHCIIFDTKCKALKSKIELKFK